MSALTPVRVKDCNFHPGGHSVFVLPTISLEGGIAAERAMFDVASTEYANEAERVRALTYAWAPIFARFGAADWDLCDDEGNPLPFDVEAILADYSMARLVADKCGELGYGAAVISPFQGPQAKPSRNGRTPATTSRRPRPIRK